MPPPCDSASFLFESPYNVPMAAPIRLAAISGLLAGCLLAVTPSSAVYSIPLHFETNTGQAPPAVKYVSQSQRAALELEDHLMRLRPRNGSPGLEVRFERAQGRGVEPGKPLDAAVTYYRGSASARISETWSEVRYAALYPGIDLRVYESSGNWEFDYIVEPGADPSRIGIAVSGARRLEVDRAGDLVATTKDGETIRWRRPRARQGRNEVAADFAVHGRQVSFSLGPWDRSRELVIDPIVYSEYFGGSGNEMARAIAAANDGSIYTCGGTNSGDLPTSASSFQPNYHGSGLEDGTGDAFVAKFSSSGRLLWTTYLGGSNDDSCTALALDSAGNPVVVGTTLSSDFHVTASAAQKNYAGAGGNNSWFDSGDGFVAKFTASGALTWSTYLGGSSDDGASGVVLDSNGDVYVTGFTLSTDFPGVTGGYQTTNHGSANLSINNGYVTWWNTGDAFVAELDPAGQHVLHATYLGGSLDEGATSIALDPTGAGGVWIGGITKSANFPTVTPLQGNFGGASSPPRQPIASFGDGFLAKFNLSLNQLLYSTYLGGSEDDGIFSIAVDGQGNVYATGFTLSSNFPVSSGAYQKAFHGPNPLPQGRFVSLGDAFALKLNPVTNKLVYSTLLGGSDDDAGTGIAVDANGNAYICGSTKSSDFPLSKPIQSAIGGFFGTEHFGDGFVAKLDASGGLAFSSFLGGNGGDAALGIALDPTGKAWVTGITNSTNFPVTSGLQSALGGEDTFITAISSCHASSRERNPQPAFADTDEIRGEGECEPPAGRGEQGRRH